MKTQRSPRNDGFTLVELMIVVLILGTLVLLAIPVVRTSAAKAQSATCLANRTITERAEYLFQLETGSPSASIAALITANYMKAIPQCPAKGVYVWQEPKGNGVRTLACSIHYAEGLKSLFSSNFTDMTGLTPLMGKWSIVNGKLVPSYTDWQNRITFGSKDWKDYNLSVTANLTSGSGYGVYYRADGAANISGYCFQFDPGLGNKFVVRTVTAGKESGPLKTVSMPAGFNIYGVDHKIEVSVVGTHQIIKVDGLVVMEFDDATFTSGSAGLRTWNQSKAAFDDLSVDPVLGK